MSLLVKKQPFRVNTSKLNTSSVNISKSKNLLKTKSLIDPLGLSILQLSQQQIHFINTQVNQTYQVTMYVRNVSQLKQQIRIKKPKSSLLSIKLSKQSSIIAPGLDIKIVISFQCKEIQKIQDKFVIQSENQQYDVKIFVIPEANRIEFQPFVNFGFIKINHIKQYKWKIQNKNDTPSMLILKQTIKSQNSQNIMFKIQPKSFTIQPKSFKQILLTIQSSQCGHIEGSIDIEPRIFAAANMDFVANFCQFNRMISDNEGNQLNEIQIQQIFSGQQIQISTNLVNNTPKTCEYRISKKKGNSILEENNNLITPQQFGRDDSEKLISFNPSQGILSSYESVQLFIKVQAKFQQLDQQLFCNYILGRVHQLPEDKEFSYTVKVHINEEDNPLVLFLKGKSLIPKLGLSSTFLNFGEIPVNTKIQKSLRIQNYSQRTVKLQLTNSMNYTFSHKLIKIAPNSHENIIVTFCPKIVGQLNEVLALISGDFSFPFKSFGKGTFNRLQKRKSSQNKFDTTILPPINTKGQQLKVQDMDNTFLQNQVSYINNNNFNKSKQQSFFQDNINNKSTVHFQTSYRSINMNQTLNGNSIYITEQKKTKILRDRKGRQVKIIDSNNLDPNMEVQPYPAYAKNQQQQRIISKQLTPSELTNIQVGPVCIDIGKIYLRSIIKKTFHILNFNTKPIAVELNTNNLQCFSQSSDQKQIIPSQSWGGLSLKFQALKQGQFKHNLQYIINGKHFFQMMIQGQVIQPTLNVSKQQIKLFATEQDKTFEKKQTLILTNPYEYQVGFCFKTQENSLFKIEPENGSVDGNGQKIITVFHRFDKVTEFGVKIQESLKLKINHGKTIELKCVSMVPECNCTSKSQQINFKQVAIGKVYENKVILRNNSKNFTIYKITIPKQIQNIVSSSNMNGSISAQDSQQIIFKIQASSAINIDSFITFNIRGGKTVILPIKANIITPKIRIQTNKIDFGMTPIQGNPASKIITIVNDSQISVDLQFKIAADSQLFNTLKISKLLDQNSSLIHTGIQSSLNSSKLVDITIIRVNSKSRTQWVLEFTPQQVKQYELTLPLYLYNNTQCIQDLQKTLICKGIKNRLMATEKQINFGKIIIEQNIQAYQKNRILEIKNPQEEPIQWWVDDSNLYPFNLERSKGRLEAFEKVSLKVFFYSDVEGDYSKQIQFFIDQEQNESQNNQQYLKVTVKASACYPTLYFDQPYVVMPVVGLNEESKAAFEIINGGYENINIRHVVSQQFSNIDLKVNFIQGTNLGVTKKRIKVQVSFKNQKPVSFTLKINFYDANNRIFSIPISGTTDNCIYTMIQNESSQNYQSQMQKNCNFIKFYINSIGCLEDQIYEFPRSIMQNEFERLQQFLNYYSSSFEKIKLNVKKNIKFFFSFDYLSQVIKNIKSEGGFLNQIRPELLLSYNEYLQAIKLRANNNSNIFSNFTCLNEVQFQKIQRKSWLILIYQIVKVYSRVQIGKSKNTQYWSKFSAREKIISNWLQQAYLSQAKTQYPKAKNILEQLNDGQILSSVISKYTNIKILQVYGRQVKGMKQKQRRAKNIVETFSQIGINCHCRAEDILRSNPKEMLLIIEGLYLILPSYLQKGQPILFTCALGQTVTKSIQISNPSKNPITYVAKVQGCKAYVIQNEAQFIIQPNSSHQIKIKYISNINLNNTSGTLTLTGKASSKFTPSTFIFVLKSQNLGRVSQKSIQVVGQLYEQYEFGINVQNNFDNDGEFKIQILNANQNKDIPLSFFTTNHVIKIKKNQTINHSLIFLPLILENQKCLVVFKDQKVGEFQYQISGTVEMPQISLDVLKIPQTLLTNKKYMINLPIPTKNDNLLKAKKIIQGFLQKLQKKGSKTQQSFSNPIDKYFPKINYQQSYNIKILPQNQMVLLKTDTFFIKDLTSIDSTVQTMSNSASTIQQPKIPLQINMKVAAKQASFFLMIKNQSNTDIRKYKVLLNSIYKPLRYEVQMKTPVNKAITQKLPLVNLNNQANNYIITLQTNQVSKSLISIDCQKEIVVQGKCTENVIVTFKPKSQISYPALIKMENVTTGQIIEYQINGLGEQPQAQTLKFEQQIRKQKTHQIKLPIQRNSKCTVSKFTLQEVTYEKTFLITAANNIFKFKCLPKLPGLMQGKLIIQDDYKVYAYKIVLTARDVIEDEIKIKTIQRKAYNGQITIPQGEYNVVCTNTCLKFNKNFVSNKINNNVFKYQFYSTIPEEYESQLTFMNEKTGQLTYLLKIKVQEMPQIKFEVFKTELGSRHEQIIRFENHQLYPLKINGTCSHPTNFFYQPSNIIVPANGTLQAKLIYVPSRLQLQQGKINFVSQKGQKWNYHLSGYGLLQLKPKQIQMKGIIGKQNIESISFFNPFQRKVQVHVSLKNLNEQNAFELILKNNKFQLDYQQELILPILLKPKTVTVNKCLLNVALSEKIVFKYQLSGVNQYLFDEERQFKIQARCKKEQIVSFQLPYLNLIELSNDTKAKLKIVPVNVNDNMRNLIKQSIKITNDEKLLEKDGKISFEIIMKAFKPFKTLTQFMIILPNGCKWIQKIDFIFTTPNIDDKIQIIADMKKPASTRFKLTNRIKHHAKFKAYFTTNSASEFSVSPSTGELQPFGRQGTPFEIVFAPNIYKKQWQGKLIIQTDQSYWSYDVKGQLPLYLPPIGAKGGMRK